MKKILYLFLAICTFNSCNVLDMNPLDKISETNVWNDVSLIQLYVNAAYNFIPHQYTNDMFSSKCDEVYCIHNWNNCTNLQEGEMTSDNVTGYGNQVNFWASAYSNIRSINIFFDRIESSPIETSTKNQLKGEMQFLRAFIYANLIWRYGGVPIVSDLYDLNQDYTATRSSYDDCVNYIVKELDEAMDFGYGTSF